MASVWSGGSSAKRAAIRKRILIRDGYCCQRCGETEGKLHIDHIVPRRLNGSDLDENLQTLCQKCNLSKGGRFFEQPLTPPTLHDVYVPQNVSISHE